MDVDGVVAKLLLLREEFPRANVSAVVSKHPNLLGIPLDDFSSSAREVRACTGWTHMCAASCTLAVLGPKSEGHETLMGHQTRP